MRFSSFAFLLGAGLLLAGTAAAQAPLSDTPAANSPAQPGLRTAPRVSYSLNAGATFAGRYGSATYLSPTANYQLTNRLRLFTGLTYLRTQSAFGYGYSGDRQLYPGLNTNSHILLQAGGTYAMSPRLALTGSAWKDLSRQPYMPTVNPYAGGNMGSGVNLRADYQLTEHLSVSGGLRVSQGVAPGYGPYGSPMIPFGY